MTSIEWLIDQYANGNYGIGVREKAREMHKQEIIKANRDGVDMAVDRKPFIMGEQYYQETFKKD